MNRFLEFFRGALTENLGPKLFALAASLILFSLVHGAEDAQRSIFVDVVAILPPADSGKVLVSELPDRVRVTLRGSRSLLNSIRREEMDAVQVDLTDTELRYFYFEPEAFEMPVGVGIVQLAPDSIPLTWDDRGEHEIPVEPIVSGQPGEGLSLSSAIVEPAAVMVEGALSEIDALSSIRTESVSVRGLGAGTYERTVRLDPPRTHTSYPNGSSVTVRFQVVPERDERMLTELEVVAVGPSARVRPTSVDIQVRGAPDLIEDLSGDRLVPWVDSSTDELALGGTRPVEVQLRGVPHGIEVVRIDPAEVLVTRVAGGAPQQAPSPAPRPTPRTPEP
jgi:YbbR domain-containing protein